MQEIFGAFWSYPKWPDWKYVYDEHSFYENKDMMSLHPHKDKGMMSLLHQKKGYDESSTI